MQPWTTFNNYALSGFSGATTIGAPDGAKEATRSFLARFELIGLDQDVAETTVSLRRAHRLKLPDAVVWASARRHGRLLVTRDIKDFPADDPGIRSPYKLRTK